MPKPTARRVLLPVLLMLLLCSPLTAQSATGTVHGSVLDGQGQPLTNATVTLFGAGVELTTTSNARGAFHFSRVDPGVFRLTASLPGYGSAEQPELRVQLGRSTGIELRLVGGVEETLTVSASKPLDDRMVISGTQLVQEELQSLPSDRSPFAFLQQAPAVLVDRSNVGGNGSAGQPTFRGPATGTAQNDWVFDGVELTDVNANGFVPYESFDFDQLQEMQVVTGGADVGKRSPGVTVNLVTRRGTNEFRGSARFNKTDAEGYLGGFLDEANPNIEDQLAPGQCLDASVENCEVFTGTRLTVKEEVGFEAGGALMPDKLWVWGAWGQVEVGQTDSSPVVSNNTTEHHSLKLNAQLTQKNSAVVSWNAGDRLVMNRGAGPARPVAETTWDQRGPSAFYRFEDTHLISSQLFVTGAFTKTDVGFELNALGGVGPNAPRAWADTSGVWHDNYLSGRVKGPSSEFKLDGSYFFETGGVGHELRFGGRVRDYEAVSSFTWPGGDAFTFNLPFGTLLAAKRGNAPPYETEFQSAWVQDTLQTGRLTVNLGLRYDRQAGHHLPVTVAANPLVPDVLPTLEYGGRGEEFTWSDVLPRLAATYAVGEERQTLARLSFSQFADQLDGTFIRRTNPAAEAYAYFFFPPCNCGIEDTEGLNDPNLVAFGLGYDPTDPTALTSPNRNDPNLSAPITSELIASLEHARGNFVGSATATYREVDDILEMRPLVFDGADGPRPVRADDYQSVGFVRGSFPPGSDPSTYSQEVFALRNGLVTNGGSLLTNGSRQRTYLGLAVSGTKRMSNHWMLRGHINYGAAEWDVDQEYLANSNPNRLVGGGDRDGDLFLTRSGGTQRGERYLQSTWSGSLNGVFQIAPSRPWGFTFSASAYAREGYPLPYSRQVFLPEGLVTVGVVEDFDDHRLDDLTLLDLRLEKRFGLSSSPMTLAFAIDAFNVTNRGVALSRDSNLASGRLFYANDTVGPRIFRLGVRLHW